MAKKSKKKISKNKLSEKDAVRFETLYISLLHHANKRLGIIKEEELNELSGEEYTQKLAEIREKLWVNEEYFFEFVEGAKKVLSDRDLTLLESWIFRVDGVFLITEHCKGYSIYTGLKSTEKKYGVIGVYQTIDKIFPVSTLPLCVRTTLLPFEGKIITDGIMGTYPQLTEDLEKEFNLGVREEMNDQEFITDIVKYFLTRYVKNLYGEPLRDLTANTANNLLNKDTVEEFIHGFYELMEADSKKVKKSSERLKKVKS